MASGGARRISPAAQDAGEGGSTGREGNGAGGSGFIGGGGGGVEGGQGEARAEGGEYLGGGRTKAAAAATHDDGYVGESESVSERAGRARGDKVGK